MKKKNTPAPRRLNHQHERFIREMIEHGDRCRAYKAAYPGTKDRAASSGAYRLMKIPYIQGRIDDAMLRVQKKTEEAMTTLINEKLANLIGMREYLSTIVSGKTKFKKPFKAGDDVKTVEVEANASEVLRALELNLKLTRDLPKDRIAFERIVTIGINKEEYK
jgi:hypothetical protein